MRWKAVSVVAAAVLASMGVALAGAPDASLIGPMRATLDLVLPYYPPSARAAGMGNSTVALEGIDSNNPAALGFFEGHDVMLDYSRIDFNRGPDLDIGRTHVVFPMPMMGGTMKLMAFGVHTRHADVSKMMGMEASVSATEFGFAYGRKIPIPEEAGELAIGAAGYPYDPARLTLDVPGGGTFARSKAMSQLGSIRAGVMYKPIDKITFGADFTHLKDAAWAKYPGAGIPHRSTSNYFVNLWTVGMSVRPDERTVVTVQGITGRANGEGVNMAYSRFSAGIERQIPIGEAFELALRAGVLGNQMTWGFGARLPEGWRVDYALLPMYGQGVESAFGRGPFHMLGVGKSF